jgi:hypothetical protein
VREPADLERAHAEPVFRRRANPTMPSGAKRVTAT